MTRLMALKLVQLGLSGVAMFGPDREVLRRIAVGDDSWEDMVPLAVAELIKRRGFFGYVRSARE